MRKITPIEISEVLRLNDKFFNSCTETLRKNLKREHTHEEILNGLLAMIAMDDYTKEEQKLIYQLVNSYVYDMLDDYDHSELNYPEGEFLEIS